MHTDDALGRKPAHLGRDHRSRVVANRAVALVTEAAHQLNPRPRDAQVVPSALGARPREAVAGQRWDHQLEIPRQRLDGSQVLQDGAGPSVGQDERERFLSCGADMDEMDLLTVDLGGELRVLVELRLPRAPFVAATPGAHEPPDPLDTYAVCGAATGDLVGETSPGESALQVVDLRLRDVDPKRADLGLDRAGHRGNLPPDMTECCPMGRD